MSRSVKQTTARTKRSDDVFLCKQTNLGVGMPYACVVSLIGMLEPSLPSIAATPSGALAYQVREFLQYFMERDRAYWAR